MPAWIYWTLGFALLALFWPWIALAIWLPLMIWGVVSLRSGIYGAALCRLDGAGDSIALTYDDGPDPDVTPPLLDLLREHGAHATFFLVGRRVDAHPDLARRIVEEGHAVGNHSHRHSAWNNLLHIPYLRRDMDGCQAAVSRATGRTPRYYRPPMGLMNPIIAPVARSLGMRVAGWSIRSLDSWGEAAPVVVRRVLRALRPGDVVLLHDCGDPDRALAITRGILEGMRERGLASRTLP